VLGALTLETPADTPLSIPDKHWLEQQLAFIAPIFYLRQSAAISGGQALKTTTLAFFQRWFGPRHLLGKVMSTAAAGFLLLLLIPADYWVYSDAVLEHTNKHVLVAPQDGYLGAINARPGEAVTRQQVLAQLTDDELTLERRKLASQLQQYRQEYDNALATANRSQAAITNAQVEQASVQLRLLEQQLARTRLTAPIDGVIVSDDIRQSLGAPVKQGEVLFEIASADGYLVQLYVDERNITAIASQQFAR
jgi:multidrug efflux pump subunit AcrA (membrane-fusion protein)